MSDSKTFRIPEAYELVREKSVRELGGETYLLRHKKTGARVFLVSNADVNKVFMISFRTPPKDSTGVAHINEHTVLCGSRKFPLRDPFMELVKGSLNTFLNAMTASDKTMYPVASCNDQDFKNLMDVYLDAVLHPNIYTKKNTFLQEGWHYEMASEDDDLTINGVVYNEMKGAMSSPERLLDSYTQRVLFPHTPYGVESGGDPDCIPDLTYEAFLDFHRTYYHPSNSYIYLYGDMDMTERLEFLDREYLSEYDRLDVDSALPEEPAFTQLREAKYAYPVLEEDPTEESTYLSWNVVTGDFDDPVEASAMEILEHVLLEAQGAPLKQALLDAGIGTDVYGGYSDAVLQPYFSVIAKETEESEKERFLQVIRTTLEQIVKEGLKKSALRAALNISEFSAREADYGYPKGLLYGIQTLDTWLYDADPLLGVEYEDVFAELHQKIETDYFEQLIQRKFLDNPFQALIVLSPEPGLQARKEAALARELAARKAAMSPEERAQIVRQTRELKAYQESQDPPELLECLPMLRREDLPRRTRPLINELRTVVPAGEADEGSPEKAGRAGEPSGVPVMTHDIETNGIRYIKALFDVKDLSAEEIRYLGLLQYVLSAVDTDAHPYQDLVDYIEENSGGFSLSVVTVNSAVQDNAYEARLVLRTKVLADRTDFAFDLFREIIGTSHIRMEKRLMEILQELRVRMRMQLMEASHSAAMTRAGSYQNQLSAYNEQCDGIEFMRFVEDLTANFAEKYPVITEKLEALMQKIFVSARLLCDVTAPQEAIEEILPKFAAFAGSLPEGQPAGPQTDLPLTQKNESFVYSTGVQYVARSGNFARHGLAYTGSLSVLRSVLNYEYLWKELREKGGAYGCGASFARTGTVSLYSYRDPHLARTNEVYRGAPDFIRHFDASERDMTKLIIGTVSSLQVDNPLTPSQSGSRSLTAWLTGTTEEMLNRDLEQVLNTTPADIRALAGHVEAALSDGNICVLGGEKIREDKDQLKTVLPLFAGDQA